MLLIKDEEHGGKVILIYCAHIVYMIASSLICVSYTFNIYSQSQKSDSKLYIIYNTPGLVYFKSVFCQYSVFVFPMVLSDIRENIEVHLASANRGFFFYIERKHFIFFLNLIITEKSQHKCRLSHFDKNRRSEGRYR